VCAFSDERRTPQNHLQSKQCFAILALAELRCVLFHRSLDLAKLAAGF
jgi:hypothetical protein